MVKAPDLPWPLVHAWAGGGRKMLLPSEENEGIFFLTCQMRHPTTSLATTLSPIKLGAAPGSMSTLKPTGPATAAPTACVSFVPRSHEAVTERLNCAGGQEREQRRRAACGASSPPFGPSSSRHTTWRPCSCAARIASRGRRSKSLRGAWFVANNCC